MKIVRKLLLPAIVIVACQLPAAAQTLLGGAEFGAKLPHGFSIGAEAEYRSMEWVDHTDQFSLAADVGYKPLKWLKVGAQYKYIRAQSLGDLTKSGKYFYRNYWDDKHRVSVSVTGSLKVWKFNLSLRERYQYTYRPEHWITRYAVSDGLRDGFRYIDGKEKHILRSRFQVSFKPYKKCKWEPFASIELYSQLRDDNLTEPEKSNGAMFCDKWRLTAGTEFKINKHNALTLFYRYADSNDDDENESHNTIGIVYSFSL